MVVGNIVFLASLKIFMKLILCEQIGKLSMALVLVKCILQPETIFQYCSM